LLVTGTEVDIWAILKGEARNRHGPNDHPKGSSPPAYDQC